MDIQSLYYFASAARTLNFTKAAEENFIAQSAMSWHIAKLEKELGFKLFYREKPSIKLTPAGKVFLEEINPLLLKLQLAVRKAELAAKGETPSISIGYWGPAERMYLTEILRTFRKNHPDIDIFVKQADVKTNMEELLGGYIDVFFTHRLTVQNEERIRFKVFEESKLYVVMSEEHRLADQEVIKPEELEKEKFIVLDNNDTPMLEKDFLYRCQRCGFVPSIVKRTGKFDNMMLMIAANIGITVLPYGNEGRFAPGWVFKELQNSRHNPKFGFAWLKDNHNSSIRLLVETETGKDAP